MADVSKVEYFGKVLIDLTGDTVEPGTLDEGIIAHDKTGAQIVGTRKIPVYDTWTFTMDDGSTVTKQVEVSE